MLAKPKCVTPMTRERMPDWLRSMLIDKGVLTAQGLTIRAKIITHRPCGIPTLAGIDGRVAGLDTWCDLGQLSPHGELQAMLDGRRTYRLYGGELDPRDRWNTLGHPASHDRPVFAEHRCGQPIPANWCLTPQPSPARPDLEEIPW
jgi:hypothetical protein